MRVLLCYSSEPHYMAPPQLGESQVNCGPFFHDRQVSERWLSLRTPRGDYDLVQVAARLPREQQPDVIAVHVDGSSLAGTPTNLAAFKCPKVLLVADTHHGNQPISGLINYALRESFDRVVLLYDRHHVDLFRAAGIRNLHWLPSLTFAHSDARVRAAAGAERAARIALVGTTSYHPRRLRLFSALIANALPLDWQQIPQSQAIAHYGRSCIGLNASMNGDLNMRVFEIFAGGALLLTDRLKPASGLFDLFQEGRELVSFDQPEEMVELARHYLEHPQEAAAIARRGQAWFEQHFTEERRREAFRDVAFDGRDRPEFTLPPPVIRFSQKLEWKPTVAAYERIQYLHQQQEQVRVHLDASVPPAAAGLLDTLPRITTEQVTVEDSDFAVLGSNAGAKLSKASRVWLWDVSLPLSPKLGAQLETAQFKLWRADAAVFAKSVPSSGDPLVKKAQLLLQQGDLQGAFQQGAAALKSAPQSAEAHALMAELAIEARNWGLAEKMIARAHALEPGHPQTIMLARDVAIKAAPKQARRLLSVARRAFDSERFKQARTYAVRALQADDGLADAHHLLGLVHFHFGEWIEASDVPRLRLEGLAGLRRATEMEPSRADYWLERALAAQQLGLHAEAVESYRQVLKIEATGFAWYGLGTALAAQGNFHDAVEAFKAALVLAPDDLQLRQKLAEAERAGAAAPTASRRPDNFSRPALVVDQEEQSQLCPGLASARALAYDDSLSDEVAVECLLEKFATLAGQAERSLPSPCFPGPRVLLAYQPWFGLGTRLLVRKGFDQGMLVVLMGERITSHWQPPEALTRSNCRTITYRGVNLWNVCQYRLALALRKMIAQVDPQQADDHAAMIGLFGHAAALIDRALAFIERYEPQTIVIAHGYDILAAVLRTLAVERGLRVVTLENIFHRERLLWEDVSGIAVNRNLAKNFYWRYRDAIPLDTARKTVAAYFDRLPALKSAQHASPSKPAVSLPAAGAGERTMLFIGQVGTDASILFGLRGFASQVELIAALARFASERPVRLIVKLHPKENPALNDAMTSVRGLTAEWLDRDPGFVAARAQLGERLVIDADNRFNTYDLVRQADLCVTTNSQAGLEAAVMDREVVLCGDSFYGGLGFTHEAIDERSLRFSLERILDEGFRLNDGERCRLFFHIFTELYCVPKTEEGVLALMHGRPEFPAFLPAGKPALASRGESEVHPSTLVIPQRLDLVAKYLFFRALIRDEEVPVYEELYRKHITERTQGHEPVDPTTGAISAKVTVDDYVDECRRLLSSMRGQGFLAQCAVPVAADGGIGNGAHRVACALALGLSVPVRSCDRPGPSWGADWFRVHGFDQDEIARLLHGWCEIHPEQSAIFILWPAVIDHWGRMEQEIARNFDCVGHRDFDFGDHEAAFRSVVHDIYSYGQTDENPEHIERKLANLAACPRRFRVVVAFNRSKAEPTGSLATRTKRDLRALLADHAPVEKFITCHASDSPDELTYLSRVLLDPNNTRWFDLRSRAEPRPELLGWIARYKRELQKRGIPLDDACVVGSSSMEVFGLRNSTDLDFTLTARWREQLFGPGITQVTEEVDLVTKGYHRVHAPRKARDDDSLIRDSSHHFWFRGIKFATLAIVRDRKDYSRRPKDVRDVALIDASELARGDRPRAAA